MRIPTVVLGLVSIALLAAACGDATGPDPAASSPAPGGPEAAFLEYRKAIADGDLEALRAMMTAELRPQLDVPEADKMLAMIKGIIPTEFEIAGVKEDGDQATIELQADDGGKPAKGTVTMVREEGAWRIAKESWAVGDAATRPSPAPEETVEAPPPPEGWTPDGEWKLDCHEGGIPDRPALGRVVGKTFRVATADIQNAILTLSDAGAFDWNAKVVIFLFLRKEQGIEGQTFTFAPEQSFDAPAGCHVHLNWKDEAGDFQSDSKTDGFSMRLEFGRIEDGKIDGRLYMCYPDESKSYVAGSFTAKVN